MSVKNYVLVDYENVQPLAESLASLNDPQIAVIVFVGSSQKTLSYDFVSSFQRLGEGGEYVKISGNGKNALDFHIACYLGILTTKAPKACFYIVSKDTGYDPLVTHLRSKKFRVHRVAAIKSIPTVKVLEEVAGLTTAQKGEKFLKRLSNANASRPATEKTLRNSLKTFFRNVLAEAEFEEVFAIVTSSSLVKISDGKVNYSEAKPLDSEA